MTALTMENVADAVVSAGLALSLAPELFVALLLLAALRTEEQMRSRFVEEIAR